MNPNNDVNISLGLLEIKYEQIQRELDNLYQSFLYHKHTGVDNSRTIDSTIKISTGNYLSVGNLIISNGTATGSTAIAILYGNGSPVNNVNANPGSIYLNIAAGSATTLYVKESGTTATGWRAK